ncbi:MAG TPA: regulatory iron-sulfur-containing complex subunit RicT, partial [Deltaproteobacteria bacterium]|nr:regulatory iron-sulfur-containing complex subunit RicT [Deltaproteobacteria bacterium]
IELKGGSLVVVETELGQSVAKVLAPASEEEAAGLEEIKPVVREVNDADRQRMAELERRQGEYFAYCRGRIQARNLPMKLVSVEQAFDGNKLTFFFVAEGRVDFRDLLKDLVERFRMRIELRQVGSRQETCMLGGIGSCGRELCCASFLTNFQRISVKMAKNQNMTLNPTKISGLCGKLKCCLAYEKEAYANLIENLPKPGKTVYLEQGEAQVVSINVINQTFVAKLADRRFVKATASDILSKDDFLRVSEERQQDQARQRQAEREVVAAAMAASGDKEKRRRPSRKRRNRSKRKTEA